MAAVDTYFIYRYLFMLLPASPVGRVQLLPLGVFSFSRWAGPASPDGSFWVLKRGRMAIPIRLKAPELRGCQFDRLHTELKVCSKCSRPSRHEPEKYALCGVSVVIFQSYDNRLQLKQGLWLFDCIPTRTTIDYNNSVSSAYQRHALWFWRGRICHLRGPAP